VHCRQDHIVLLLMLCISSAMDLGQHSVCTSATVVRQHLVFVAGGPAPPSASSKLAAHASALPAPAPTMT